jgi:hypothetical protein
VKQTDDRLFGRAFRQVFGFRKKFTKKLLKTIITKNLPKNNKKKELLSYLEDNMEVDGEENEKVTNSLAEIEIFLQILITVFLLDNKKYKEVKKK